MYTTEQQSEHDHRHLHLSLITQHQLSLAEQEAAARAIFTQMRTTFAARWYEIGHAGLPLPRPAMERLTHDARAAAAGLVRTHNAALTQFAGTVVNRYFAQHPGDASGLRAALNDALDEWVAKRNEWKPQSIAEHMTRQALSLADLYAGGKDALYLVDGPPLTDKSCGICRSYYQHVLTPAEAWQLVFPAHPNCEHTLRLLSAAELSAYRATGRLPDTDAE